MKYTLVALASFLIGCVITGIFFIKITTKEVKDKMIPSQIQLGAKGGIYAPGYMISPELFKSESNQITIDNGVALVDTNLGPKSKTLLLAFNNGKYLGSISTNEMINVEESRFVVFTPDKLFTFGWGDVSGIFYKRDK